MARTENESNWLKGSEEKVHYGLGFKTFAESPIGKFVDNVMEQLSASVGKLGTAASALGFVTAGAAAGTSLAVQDAPVPDANAAAADPIAKAGETTQFVANDNIPAEQHAQAAVPAPDAPASTLSNLSPAAGPEASAGENVTVKIEPLNAEQGVTVSSETQTPVVAQVDSHTTSPVIAEAPPSSGMGTTDLVAAGGITLALAGGTQLTVDNRQSDMVMEAAGNAKADIVALYDQLCQSVGISRDKGFATCEATADFDKVPKQVTVAKVEQQGMVI